MPAKPKKTNPQRRKLPNSSLIQMKTVLLSRENTSFDLVSRVKRLLFLDVPDYDKLIGELLASAIEEVEQFTGLAIGLQTRRVRYGAVTGLVALPYAPVLNIQSIDAGGTYLPDKGLFSAVWPEGGSVTYQCGYTLETIPAGLLNALVRCIAVQTSLNPSLKPGDWKAMARPYQTMTWAS